MEIPITQLTNVVTIFVLVFVTVRLWKRSFQQKTTPLFLFASAFSAILLMMIMFALPFTVIERPIVLQVTFSIADLAFMAAVALFTAVTISIIFPAHRILLIVLPSAIGTVGLLIFLWQMFHPILPNLPITLFRWREIAFITYRDDSSALSKIVQGVIAICTFLVGAFLFFRQARSMEGAIHTRAFLLGLGYVTAVAAVIANYVVSVFPEFQAISFFAASLLALASVLFFYRGICVKIPKIL